MTTRVALAMALVVLATTFGSVYVARRAHELAPTSTRTKRALVALVGLLAIGPFARFVPVPEPFVWVLSVIGYGTDAAVGFACGLLLLVDLASRLTRRSAPARAPAAPVAAPLGRREMIRRTAIGAALASGPGLSSYGLTLGRHDYVLEELPVRLARLPRSLDGYTIAQLSDLHLGTFVGRREIDAARELVRRARADLVVLTGDLLDHDPRYLPDLGVLARALTDAGVRDGVVAILGNHDHFAGADGVIDTLRAAGVRVLRNRGESIGDRGGRFALLGVDDIGAHRYGYGEGADLDRALADVDPDLARVLLCHNPGQFHVVAPRVDLQLSGHTHGGQIRPGVSPLSLTTRYLVGHYRVGDAQLYVNRGLGTVGPPMRIGSAPEVTRITLVAGRA